jgi:hypothetical protein
MKKVLIALFAVTVCSMIAMADVPDPANCSVTPSDALDGAVLCPASPSAIDASVNTIVVHNGDDDPIPGASVEVLFTALNNICPSAVLTGTCDSTGTVTITFEGGGCAHVVPSAAVVKANGVTIRDYQNAKSPDYDGASGNGTVDLSDLIDFSNQFLDVEPNECHDYDNNGNTGLEDLIVFGGPFLNLNQCQ